MVFVPLLAALTAPVTAAEVPQLPLSAAPAPVAAPETTALPVRRRYWYGWQLVPADLAALALVFAGDSKLARAAGLGLFIAGAPTVHLLQANQRGALWSGLLRAAVPLALLAVVEWAPGTTEEKPYNAGLGVVAAGLTGVGFMVFDWASLAHADRVFPREAALLPVVRVGRHAGVVGLAGAF